MTWCAVTNRPSPMWKAEPRARIVSTFHVAANMRSRAAASQEPAGGKIVGGATILCGSSGTFQAISLLGVQRSVRRRSGRTNRR